MLYNLPSPSAFKEQFDRDFPYSVPAYGAVLAAVLSAGSIIQINIIAGGQGYKTAPGLMIEDTTGTGAAATPVISNTNPTAGQVIGVSGLTGGSGYTAPVLTVTGGAGDDTDRRYVRDIDIARAIIAAGILFPCQLPWGSQQNFTYVYNLLSAHFLVLNVTASSQGVRGQGEWFTNSKSVGDLSVAYSIPDRILKSPIWAPLIKTTYGVQFLSLLAQYLVGNVHAVMGATKP